MNIFNRVVVLLLLLLLIVTLVIAAVVPNTLLERLIYTFQQAQDLLASRWPMSYLVFLVADAAVVLILLVVLWLQIRPRRRKLVAVRSVGGTKAEINTDSVRQSLEYRVGTLPDVVKVKSTVEGKRGGVDVVLALETTPEIDIPAKMDEVTEASRELIEGKMGLKLAGIKVQIKQAAYGRGNPPPSEAAAVEDVFTAPASPEPSTSPWGAPAADAAETEPGNG